MRGYLQDFKLYKPQTNGKGSAFQFQPNNDLKSVQISATLQTGSINNKAKCFDWTQKIVFKLGTTDLLKLINAFEIVRTARYKYLLKSNPAECDKFMQALCDKKGEIESLIHTYEFDGKKVVSSLTVKPNGAQYKGGFRVTISSNKGGENKFYSMNIYPDEILSILYTLEKPLRLERLDFLKESTKTQPTQTAY